MINAKQTLAAIGMLLVLMCPAAAQEQTPDPAIEKILQAAIAEHGYPGLVAAIAKADEPIRIGAAGVRKHGDDEPITIHDKLHLGSDTKAITATMIARLVERGEISWDTTAEQVLPKKIINKIHPSFHDVTIEELLTHRSGVPNGAKNWWKVGPKRLTDLRGQIMVESLAEPSKIKRGEYEYSNLGYMIAGLMVATKKQTTWEALIKREIFKPLKITSGGFGPPGKKGKVNQPWGHLNSAPLQHDNAPALGPAGTIHLSMSDWARFCLQHTDSSDEEFLKPESRKSLHTPAQGGDYAKGWGVYPRRDGKGIELRHAGSNTMWFSLAVVEPQASTAYLVVTNTAPKNAGPVSNTIIEQLRHLDRPEE